MATGSKQPNPISPLPRRTSQLNMNLLLTPVDVSVSPATGPDAQSATGSQAKQSAVLIADGHLPKSASVPLTQTPQDNGIRGGPAHELEREQGIPIVPSTREQLQRSVDSLNDEPSLPASLSHLEHLRNTHISPPIQIHSPSLMPPRRSPSPAPANALAPLVGSDWWGSGRKSWFELANDVSRALSPAGSSSPQSRRNSPSPHRKSRQSFSRESLVGSDQSLQLPPDASTSPRRNSTPALDPSELAALRSTLEFYDEYRRHNLNLHDLPEEGGPVYLDPAAVVQEVEDATSSAGDSSESRKAASERRRSVWKEASDSFKASSWAANGTISGDGSLSKSQNGGAKRGWFDFDFDLVLDSDVLSRRPAHERKFLGEYSESILRRACHDMGLDDELAKQGYTRLVLRIDDKDAFVHRLTITDESLFEGEWEKHGRKTPGASGLDGKEIDLKTFAQSAPLRDDNYLVDMFVRISSLSLTSFKSYQQLLRLRSQPSDASFLLHSLSPESHYAPLMDLPVDQISEVIAFMEKELGGSSQQQQSEKYTEVSWLSCQNPRVGWVRNVVERPGSKSPGVETNSSGEDEAPNSGSTLMSESVYKKRRPSKASLRAPLPGQKHPGSGVAKRITFMLVSFVRWR
ncbi:hypothetical protein HDU93_002962, partial [Gonapodya sp. JEL0774]